MIKRAATLQVVEDDYKSNELVVDVTASPMERGFTERLHLGELGIVILNAYKGIWRFDSDPLEKIRRSIKHCLRSRYL
ncbi:hypothetical protein KEJ27_08595 [Candidatus Bathyarchaeota archaeon]|nr:hypothetical protein [Candidatus Bathyarchaeota archaeon]MBS7617432.1 hypothetical protein [Candidatus Bathyarchaeota archaeon]